ncbi:MAG: SPASM domain-containing protein, partial [bacterium]|nr:SPASM domain-containing protein [bacterium]
DAFGDVYLCCYYLRRKKTHWLGNVYKNPLKDIWFGQRHMKVARHTRVAECNKMDCRWIGFNNRMKPFVYDDRLRQLDFV